MAGEDMLTFVDLSCSAVERICHSLDGCARGLLAPTWSLLLPKGGLRRGMESREECLTGTKCGCQLIARKTRCFFGLHHQRWLMLLRRSC
jgi:hypothetical protein